MKEKSFYVTLPSNASMESYPKNIPSNFTILLEEALELNSKFEVALVEISNFSNFSVIFGKIKFENPFTFFLMGGRPSIIELSLKIKNGISLQEFCKILNVKIFLKFVKTEYLFRYRRAFKDLYSNDIDFEKRIIYLLKKKSTKDSYEFQVSKEFKFHQEIENLGGIYDFQTSKFKFSNIEKLSEVFDLNIQISPEFEENETVFLRDSFFYEKENLFSEDFFILRKNSKLDLNQIFIKSHLPYLNKIFEKFTAKFDNNLLTRRFIPLNFPYLEFLPKFSALDSNILEISSCTDLLFFGLISKLLTKSNLEEYTLRKKETFLVPDFIQTVKSIAIYTDIIESQYFGDVRSQIIRILNIKSVPSDDTLHILNPQYLNVKCSKISSINIEIRDMNGNKINYIDNFSSLNITLHFRIKN
jgi:hypothetical protein